MWGAYRGLLHTHSSVYSVSSLRSARLHVQDSDVQVVSQSRAPVVNARAPGPLIRKADGLDIVKKASSRKGRCLLLFSCELSLVPGGELVSFFANDHYTDLSIPCSILLLSVCFL